MVIRNSKGVVLGSKVIINENIPSVFTAEVIACLQSLMFGLDLGFSNIEVKGDPLAVIKKLRSNNEDKSESRTFIRDCQSLSKRFHTSFLILLEMKWIRTKDERLSDFLF
ncbi:hypothetical protein Gotur_006873 [Gossypium turneri]